MKTDDTLHLEYVDDETKAIGACRAALRDLDLATRIRIVTYLEDWNAASVRQAAAPPTGVSVSLDAIARPDPVEPMAGLVATGEFKTDVQF